MKKTILFITFALLATVTTPTYAQTPSAIAIIDANFDTSLVDNVVDVCVVSSCLKTIPKTTEAYKTYNHGIIMADIVRSQNPNTKLFLLRASTVNTSSVTGDGFESALDWLTKNAKANNIIAVSSSLAFGDGVKCLPTTSRNKNTAHASIVAKIANLKNTGLPIYSAAGNVSIGVSYPSCINDLIVVSTPGYNEGSPFVDIKTTLNSFDGYNYVSKKIKSNSFDLATQSTIDLVSQYFVRVYNTTSVGTALAVSKISTGNFVVTLVK
jgi:hypothetical protein